MPHAGRASRDQAAAGVETDRRAVVFGKQRIDSGDDVLRRVHERAVEIEDDGAAIENLGHRRAIPCNIL